MGYNSGPSVEPLGNYGTCLKHPAIQFLPPRRDAIASFEDAITGFEARVAEREAKRAGGYSAWQHAHRGDSGTRASTTGPCLYLSMRLQLTAK